MTDKVFFLLPRAFINIKFFVILKMVSQEDILGFFKEEFESLMLRFNDKRQINYDLDIFSEIGLVECNWNQQQINISFKVIPIKYYLSNPPHREIFKDNPELYRNFFIQVARHEYAHSISIESFKKIQSYTLALNEFTKSYRNNLYFKVYLNEIFLDFVANFLIYHKIDMSIPREHIRLNLYSFESTFTVGHVIFTLLKVCLLTSQIFYIYGLWNNLNPVFEKFNLQRFQDFLFMINDIFKKIILKNTENVSLNIDSAIAEITTLAEILDSIKWKKIVLENYDDVENYDLLKKYKMVLKKK